MQILPNSKHPVLCMLRVFLHCQDAGSPDRVIIESSFPPRALALSYSCLFLCSQLLTPSTTAPGAGDGWQPVWGHHHLRAPGDKQCRPVGLLHLCRPGWRVTDPAGPVVPELHVVKGNWKQQHVFQRMPGLVIHCWSRVGEEGGADGDGRRSSSLGKV